MSAVRTVVAVLLAGALLAVGLPAAGWADEQRTATRLDGTAAELLATAERLARESDATRHGTARRTIVVRVPHDGVLRLDGAGPSWRVDGGPWHRRRGRVPVVATDPTVLLDSGRHRLRLSLRQRDGEVVVTVARARPVSAADPEIETGGRDQTPRVRRTGLVTRS